ncbi:MAG: hypothetical protein WBH24_06035 [Candidatus Acidiferrum sp.]
MIRARFALLAGAVLAAATAQAQSAAPPPAPASSAAQTETMAGTLPSGTAVNAELNSSVNSKKVKVGEKIEAHTTEAIEFAGKTILPKGTKLEGHVTEATARSKGDSGSTLAIQFDKAIPRKGEELPLDVMIMAIAAPQEDSYAGSVGPSSDPMRDVGGAAAAGSPMGVGKSQPPPNVAQSSPSGAPADSTEPKSHTQLPATSRGVYGLKDLKIMMVALKTSQTTVITSSGKDVHLDDGTRLLLVAAGDTQAGPSK